MCAAFCLDCLHASWEQIDKDAKGKLASYCRERHGLKFKLNHLVNQMSQCKKSVEAVFCSNCQRD